MPASTQQPNVNDTPQGVTVASGSEAEQVHQVVSKWTREAAYAIRSLQNSFKSLADSQAAVVTVTPAATAAATPGTPGSPGTDGWTPMISLVPFGVGVIMRIVGWIGGTGSPPTSGLYVGATGLVSDPLLAVNVRGPAGAPGGSYVTVINVMDYGADLTGVVDSSAAVTAAVAACAPDGVISELILRKYISGFPVPAVSPAATWAARPAVAAVGGLGAGFAAVGNINDQGYLGSFEITNPGSGYNVLSVLCARVNTSDVITIASGTFDTRLVAGVSVRHESITQGATIINRISGTQLQLSEAMTFSNTDTFVFGLPWITVNAVAQYDNVIPILGTPKMLYFPPGKYLLPGGIGVFMGKSNVTIEAKGVDFMVTGIANGIWMRICTGIVVNDGRFKFTGAKFSYVGGLPNRTRYGGAEGIIVGCCQEVTFNRTELWDALDFSFAVGGDGRANRPLCSRINLLDVVTINGLGDGIHFSGGSVEGRVSGARILMPGDDALAAVNDGATAQKPDDILFENCVVEGGLYRGCVAIGCTRVTWQNIKGRDTHGPFCWAANDAGDGAPTDIAFMNICARNLGNTAISGIDGNSGKGIYGNTMDRLFIRDLVFTQDATVIGTNALYDVAAVTNLNSDQDEIESTGTVATLGGALNTDLDTATAGPGVFAGFTLGPGRWAVEGTVTARSSTGAAPILWPVFFDGTVEYGKGSSTQTNNLAQRFELTCHGFINIAEGATRNIRFKIKQAAAGETIDAGTTSGPNSYMRATRIS